MATNYDYKTGFVVYPKDSSGAAGRKAPYIDHGTDLIRPERYYTREEADLEWQHLWTQVWCWAGITHDLAEIGDWFRCDIGRESFIVLRTAANTIKAYYNVCPHRGNRLMYDDRGHIDVSRGQSIYCNFHGWRFNLDGSTKHVRDQEFGLFRPETLCGMNGLKEVRCEVWNSLVFINMDPQAMPLLEYLDVIPEHLKNYDFSRLRLHRHIEGIIAANWKVGMEAFIEFYHADDTHPQAIPVTATLETQYDLYRNGMSRMIIPVGFASRRNKDPNVVNDGLKMFVSFFGGDNSKFTHLKGYEYDQALCTTMRGWAQRNGHADLFDRLTDDQVTDDWNYHVFPTITLNVFSYTLLIQSWTPHPSDPEQHLYRVFSMHLPLLDKNQPVMDPVSYAMEDGRGFDGRVRPQKVVPQTLDDWGSLLRQDVERIPNVQQGIRSRSYDGHRLCESENRVRHYLAEIDHYLGRRSPPRK